MALPLIGSSTISSNGRTDRPVLQTDYTADSIRDVMDLLHILQDEIWMIYTPYTRFLPPWRKVIVVPLSFCKNRVGPALLQIFKMLKLQY